MKEILPQSLAITLTNNARQGGTIHSEDNCGIYFEGTSATEFNNNTADYGGSIRSQNKCHISFESYCIEIFHINN